MNSDPAAFVTPAKQRNGRTLLRCWADERIRQTTVTLSAGDLRGHGRRRRLSFRYPRRAAGTEPEKTKCDCFQTLGEPFCTLNRFDILIEVKMRDIFM